MKIHNALRHPSNDLIYLHHEQGKNTQVTFENEVNGLGEVVEKTRNSFAEQIRDLLVLDSRDISSPEMVESIKQVEQVWQQKVQCFVESRLLSRTTSLSSHPLKQPTFCLAIHRS